MVQLLVQSTFHVTKTIADHGFISQMWVNNQTQTHRQTKQTDGNTPLSYWGGIIIKKSKLSLLTIILFSLAFTLKALLAEMCRLGWKVKFHANIYGPLDGVTVILLTLNFILKNNKLLFEPPFGGLWSNIRTSSIARRKARGWLFIRHDIISEKLLKSTFFKGVGNFERKFQTEGGVAHQPLLVSEN